MKCPHTTARDPGSSGRLALPRRPEGGLDVPPTPWEGLAVPPTPASPGDCRPWRPGCFKARGSVLNVPAQAGFRGEEA